MPYITADRKTSLLYNGHDMESEGELNYLITRMLIKWIEQNGVSYRTLNAAVGAIEAAKLEFYRRVVAPYEEQKMQDNGDVYPLYFFK